MRLRVLIPTRVAVDEEVDAVVAPGQNGSFGLLPRHVDFVNALAPGLISYRREGEERFVGVDGGLLIKRGELVRVATPRATAGAELGEVERLVREDFLQRSEGERRALQALDKLEAEVLRRIARLEGRKDRER